MAQIVNERTMNSAMRARITEGVRNVLGLVLVAATITACSGSLNTVAVQKLPPSAPQTVQTQSTRAYPPMEQQQILAYITAFKNGQATFSLNMTGKEAARLLGFGNGFINFYDQLRDRVDEQLETTGQITKEEAATMADQVLRENMNVSPYRQTGLEVFFKGIWSDYFRTLILNQTDELPTITQDLIYQAGQYSQALADMVKQMTPLSAGTIPEESDVDKFLKDWKKFNEGYLMPNGYYAAIGMHVNRHKIFYSTLIFKIEGTQQRKVNGINVLTIYGHRVDRTFLKNNLAYSRKGDRVVVIDIKQHDIMVNSIIQSLQGETYYIFNSKSGIHEPAVTAKVREIFSGMSKEQIRNQFLYSTRIHELSHQAQDILGDVYKGTDRFGLPVNVWSNMIPEQQKVLDEETGAMLAQFITAKDSRSELLDMLNQIFSEEMDDPEEIKDPHYIGARWILNRLDDRPVDQKDWQDHDGLIEQFLRLWQKGHEQIRHKAEELMKNNWSDRLLKAVKEANAAMVGSPIQVSLKNDYAMKTDEGRRKFLKSLAALIGGTTFWSSHAAADVVLGPEVTNPTLRAVLSQALQGAVLFLSWPMEVNNDPELKKMADAAKELLTGNDITYTFYPVDLQEMLRKQAEKRGQSAYMQEMLSKGTARAEVQKIDNSHYRILYDVRMLQDGMAGLTVGIAHEVIAHTLVNETGLSNLEIEREAFRLEIKYLDALLKQEDLHRRFLGAGEEIWKEIQQMVEKDKQVMDWINRQIQISKPSLPWSTIGIVAGAVSSATAAGILAIKFRREKRLKPLRDAFEALGRLEDFNNLPSKVRFSLADAFENYVRGQTAIPLRVLKDAGLKKSWEREKLMQYLAKVKNDKAMLNVPNPYPFDEGYALPLVDQAMKVGINLNRLEIPIHVLNDMPDPGDTAYETYEYFLEHNMLTNVNPLPGEKVAKIEFRREADGNFKIEEIDNDTDKYVGILPPGAKTRKVEIIRVRHEKAYEEMITSAEVKIKEIELKDGLILEITPGNELVAMVKGSDRIFYFEQTKDNISEKVTGSWQEKSSLVLTNMEEAAKNGWTTQDIVPRNLSLETIDQKGGIVVTDIVLVRRIDWTQIKNGVLTTSMHREDGQWKRDTLHFSGNHPVVENPNASWEDSEVTVIIPLYKIPKHRIENFNLVDTWIRGDFELPKGAVIIGQKSLPNIDIGKAAYKMIPQDRSSIEKFIAGLGYTVTEGGWWAWSPEDRWNKYGAEFSEKEGLHYGVHFHSDAERQEYELNAKKLEELPENSMEKDLAMISEDHLKGIGYSSQLAQRSADQAMATGNIANRAQISNLRKGGIDLTPANMDLQTRNAGAEIKFHLDPAQLAQLQNAPGFVPVIINIQPLDSLPKFLGIDDSSVVPARV